MRTRYFNQTGTGSTNPFVIDRGRVPTNISIGCKITSGSATYSVQYTYDDPFAVGFDPATAKWFTHSTITGQTGDSDGNIAFPCRAVRLTVSSGTGTVQMAITQSGN